MDIVRLKLILKIVQKLLRNNPTFYNNPNGEKNDFKYSKVYLNNSCVDPLVLILNYNAPKKVVLMV